MAKKIRAAIAAMVVVAASLLASPSSAQATEVVNMDLVCQQNHGLTYMGWYRYPSQGAYGWACWVPPWGASIKGADVQRYCQAQFGTNAWLAYNGRDGWRCG